MPAAGVTLTVDDASGSASQQLVVPITVDNPELLAGAAFTLQYDAALTVEVESTFFDTFYNQFDVLTNTGEAVEEGSGWKFPLLDESGNPVSDENAPVYVPAQVAIDNQIYDQPLVDKTEIIGSQKHHRIAAARCMPASSGDNPTTTIFTLNVSLNQGESVGIYDISIVPTTLNNPDAGYNGESIDLLIGSDLSQPLESGNAFPVLLADADYAANVFAGTIVFSSDPDDSDGDGMSDTWEIEHFGDLSRDGSDDSDSDGYTDYQEYLNETDPNDSTTVENLAGYSPCTDSRAGSLVPVIASFSANPAIIESSENAVLSWSITGAATASIDHEIGEVDPDAGTRTVSPESTTTYTLTATNDCGTVTKTTSVNVKINAPPDAPVLLSPASGADDVVLMAELETEAFLDPDNDAHVTTRWQIAKEQPIFDDETFVVYDEITEEYLTRIIVPPDMILEKDTVYYWRVLFSDGNAWSEPSEISSFTTVDSGPVYVGGIREESRLADGEAVRLGNEFTAIDDGPVNTETRKVFRSATESGVQVGIRAEDATIDKCGSIDPENFSDKVDILPDLPFGLFEIALKVANPGDTAEVTFHFTEPVQKAGFVWWKYDPNKSVFYDYEAEAGADVVTVNEDGSVTIRLKDGGYGDLIDNPDGRIIDPGGPGAAVSADSDKESGGGGGGGCFVDTLLRCF